MKRGIDLAAIVERDAHFSVSSRHAGLIENGVRPTSFRDAVADRRDLLTLLRETTEQLGWTLRNNGGECPADYPTSYVKAMEVYLAGRATQTTRPGNDGSLAPSGEMAATRQRDLR